MMQGPDGSPTWPKTDVLISQDLIHRFLRLGSCNLLSSSASLYMPISPFIYHGGTRSFTHSPELLMLHRHFGLLFQGQVNKEM